MASNHVSMIHTHESDLDRDVVATTRLWRADACGPRSERFFLTMTRSFVSMTNTFVK